MNLQPFINHGITKLSASSLNQFVGDRACWCLQRLLKIRMPAGITAERGHAGEHGAWQSLRTLGKLSAADECRKYLDRLKPEFGEDPKWDEVYGEAPKASELAANCIRLEMGKPPNVHGAYPGKEGLIETTVLGVRLTGYIDFLWNDTAILDLKMTSKMPFGKEKTAKEKLESLDNGHLLQQAIYARALGLKTGLCYATPSRCEIVWLPKKLLAEKFEEAKRIVLAMAAFLALSKNPERLARSQPPNYSHYFWSHPEARRLGKEFYGY